MRFSIFLFFILFLTSCQHFDKKKVNAEDLLENELQAFNWNEVDTYPSFESCDSTLTKAQQKQCFQNTMTSLIANHLNDALLVVTEDVNDTVVMEFRISDKGDLTVKSIQSSALIKQQIPAVDSLLLESVKDMPAIFPAIKRGQHVTTEFKLPVVVSTN